MNFDWREVENEEWRYRFRADAAGADRWREAGDLVSLLTSLEDLRYEEKREIPQPTLFISHRKADLEPALEVTKLARDEGFDVWLDVLDPGLAAAQGTGSASSLLVACVIEMALLNSTHLVAVMTRNTSGSQWVPYEFGRVKADFMVDASASSWLLPEIQRCDVPEYLLLCPMHHTLEDVHQWLRWNLSHVRRRQPGMRRPSL